MAYTTTHSSDDQNYTDLSQRQGVTVMRRFFGVALWFCAVFTGMAPVAAQITTYAQLRATSGASGDTVEVVNNTIGGFFVWNATDPYSQGDDNGIVIAGPSEWWVRDFAHTRVDPVQLDWFELAANDDITALVDSLAGRYAPDLHLKMVTSALTLISAFVDFSGRTETLTLGAGHALAGIAQSATSPDSGTVWKLEGYKEVYLDSNITFTGHEPFGRPCQDNCPGATLHFKPMSTGAVRFESYVNITESPAFGLNHIGGVYNASTERVPYAAIGGQYLSSGVRGNAGIDTLHVVGLYVSDPYGHNLGWDETTGTASQANKRKARGIWMQQVLKLTGDITLEFGNAHWFMAKVGEIGNSIADPLVITYRNLSWLANGRVIPPPDFQTQGGKPDGLITTTPANKRFIRLNSDGNTRLEAPLGLESTGQTTPFETNNIHFTMDGLRAREAIKVGGFAGGGGANEVQGHTFTGTAEGFAVTGSPHNLFSHIGAKSWHFTRYVALPDYDVRPDSNVVAQATLADSGAVTIAAGQGLVFTALTVEGTARPFMQINNAAEPDTVTVAIIDLVAPTGSTITAEDPTKVQLTVDGRLVALPYTVGATYALPPLKEQLVLPVALDSTHVLFDNWVLYFFVDQTAGALNNLVPLGPDGTLLGDATYTGSTTQGQVLTLDGDNDYVSFGTGVPGDISGYNGFSVGVVFKGEADISHYMIGKKETGKEQWGLMRTSNNSVELTRANTTGGDWLSVQAGTAPVGEWVSAVATVDHVAGVARLYVGTAAVGVDSTTNGTVSSVTTSKFYVGGRGAYSNEWHGQLKTGFLANRVMTAAEAAAWIADPVSPLRTESIGSP